MARKDISSSPVEWTSALDLHVIKWNAMRPKLLYTSTKPNGCNVLPQGVEAPNVWHTIDLANGPHWEFTDPAACSVAGGEMQPNIPPEWLPRIEGVFYQGVVLANEVVTSSDARIWACFRRPGDDIGQTPAMLPKDNIQAYMQRHAPNDAAERDGTFGFAPCKEGKTEAMWTWTGDQTVGDLGIHVKVVALCLTKQSQTGDWDEQRIADLEARVAANEAGVAANQAGITGNATRIGNIELWGRQFP